MEEPASKVSQKKVVLEGDNWRFRRYMKTGGIRAFRHIFLGKSKVRRFLWLLLFLAAIGGCTYAITDRVLYLVSKPTATTVSVDMGTKLSFPAVTVCNMNLIKKSYLQEKGLLDAFFDTIENGTVDKPLPLNYSDFDFYDLLQEGKQEKFILGCEYMGQKCSETTTTYTQLGLCYTFNSGRNNSQILTVDGTGDSHGLKLVLNISREEYLGTPYQDVGVKIAIHHQGEPGEPENTGIAVPPGRTAFIGLRQTTTTDKSSRHLCKPVDDTEDLNFLRGENYSVSACLLDCFFKNIAKTCNCIEAKLWNSSAIENRSLPDCGTNKIRCLLKQYYSPPHCNLACPIACDYTTYTTSISYSAFLPPKRQRNGRTVDNTVVVKIYFEDLNVKRVKTVDVYGVVELLSNIGGNMGLLLGVGIITVFELLVWIGDELKDRCCRVSERKIATWLKQMWKKATEGKSRRHNISVELLGTEEYHASHNECETAFGSAHEYETCLDEDLDVSEDSEGE